MGYGEAAITGTPPTKDGRGAPNTHQWGASITKGGPTSLGRGRATL